MNTVIDEKLQRRMKLNGFVSSECYAETIETVGEHMQGIQGQIDELHLKPINESKLAELNFQLGIKTGLTRVLNVLKGFEEELLGD